MKDSKWYAPLFFIPVFLGCGLLSQLDPKDVGWFLPIELALGLMLLLRGAFLMSSKSGRERYQSPDITGARITTDNLHGEKMVVGELDVESSHGQHVLRELHLPVGAVITTQKRNKRYRVQWEMTSDGLDHADGVTQAMLDKWNLEGWLKANGVNDLDLR